MADIGYGYGSEFQLLRFMGRHRKLLEQEISRQIGQEGCYNWLDFGFSDRNRCITGDEEIKGLSFLKDLELISKDAIDAIYKEYQSYGIRNLNKWQNWDAIFTLNGELYLVEAKAHIDELTIDDENGGRSFQEILRFLKDLLPQFSVTEKWMGKYYQLANRLATTALLNKHGVRCKTLYLFFVNGYSRRERIKDKSPLNIIECKDASINDFKYAITNEMLYLGIDERQVSGLLAPYVFVDANPHPNKDSYYYNSQNNVIMKDHKCYHVCPGDYEKEIDDDGERAMQRAILNEGFTDIENLGKIEWLDLELPVELDGKRKKLDLIGQIGNKPVVCELKFFKDNNSHGDSPSEAAEQLRDYYNEIMCNNLELDRNDNIHHGLCKHFYWNDIAKEDAILIVAANKDYWKYWLNKEPTLPTGVQCYSIDVEKGQFLIQKKNAGGRLYIPELPTNAKWTSPNNAFLDADLRVNSFIDYRLHDFRTFKARQPLNDIKDGGYWKHAEDIKIYDFDSLVVTKETIRVNKTYKEWKLGELYKNKMAETGSMILMNKLLSPLFDKESFSSKCDNICIDVLKSFAATIYYACRQDVCAPLKNIIICYDAEYANALELLCSCFSPKFKPNGGPFVISCVDVKVQILMN